MSKVPWCTRLTFDSRLRGDSVPLGSSPTKSKKKKKKKDYQLDMLNSMFVLCAVYNWGLTSCPLGLLLRNDIIHSVVRQSDGRAVEIQKPEEFQERMHRHDTQAHRHACTYNNHILKKRKKWKNDIRIGLARHAILSHNRILETCDPPPPLQKTPYSSKFRLGIFTGFNNL